MDLLYIFRLLLRRKWMILTLSILTAILTFVLVLLQKDAYESVAQYSTGFTAEKVKLTDGSVAVDIYTVDIKFNNVIETFKSPRVIGMLSYKLLLHDLRDPANAYRHPKESDFSTFPYKVLPRDTIIEILENKIRHSSLLQPIHPKEKNLLEYLKVYRYDDYELRKLINIQRVEMTDYIDIVCQSEHAQLSADIVNTLGTEFLNYYKKLNDQRNTESAQQIQQLLTLQQQKVDSFTNELKIARISQGALDPVEKTKNAMETTKELQIELSTAQSEYNLQSRLFESYGERLRMLSGSLRNNSAQDALSLFEKRDMLREQIAKSPQPDHELSAQLRNIESLIKAQSGTVNRSQMEAEIPDLQNKANEARARMNAAAATVSQLNRLIATSRNLGNVSPKTQVEIDAIERQLEIENTELKTLRDKLGQAEGLIRDDPTSNFKQTLIGQPDSQPVPKHKIIKTGLAGMSVLVITSLIIIITAVFDRSIRTSMNFMRTAGLPLKTTLNEINLKRSSIDEIILDDQDDKRQAPETPFRNNIRKLRHEMEKSGSQVFLFTSTSPGTGKSVVLQSIAYSLLKIRKTVLILDLNFESNTLTRMFGTDRFMEEGATDHADLPVDVLIEEMNRGEYNRNEPYQHRLVEPVDPAQYVSATAHQGLYIAGCQQGNHTPSEILSFPFLFNFLLAARRKYDFILIESASMNSRSDSFELFRFADRVVTVFSAKDALSYSDQKSIEALQGLKDKNFGSVLNQVEFENLDL